LHQALETPGAGDVEEEADAVEAWVRDIQRTLRDWHRVLQAELTDAETLLRSQLDELSAVAPLHEVPAVRDAREAIDGLRRSAARPRRDGLGLDGLSEGLRRVIPDDARSDLSAVKKLVRLADDVGILLNSLATLDKAEAELVSTVLEPLSDPVERWREAEAEASRAFADLQHLEATSARLSPPVSCDTAPVAAHLASVEERREQLLQGSAKVAEVATTLDEIAAGYREVVKMVAQREDAYGTRRAELDATLDRLEAWCADLEAYEKLHRNDPAIRAAVRARLDEVESAWTQLQIQYERGSGAVARWMTS
jgi:DNA repair exonuclease SbcCD ATPase subunit